MVITIMMTKLLANTMPVLCNEDFNSKNNE